MPKINIDVCSLSERAKLPQLATPGSAAFDLTACFHTDTVKVHNGYNLNEHKVAVGGDKRTLILPSDCWALVPTGLIFLLPKGIQMKIIPRSGLALKKGLTVLNSPGTVDSDYTFETFVLLHNISRIPTGINEGERIAQCEFVSSTADMIDFRKCGTLLVEEIRLGVERSGGFGSTGK